MPKKVTKKNYRNLHRGGWGGNNTQMNQSPPSIREIVGTKKSKKGKKGKKGKKDKKEKSPIPNSPKISTPNLYGGGWGRPMARSVYYDASPKMEMKKNFMNKYFKKYFN